jgi:hypothetical protein
VSEEQPELTPEQLGKKSFEVRYGMGKNSTIQKAIFIDGELLDWRVDMSTYLDAMKMGPMYMREIQKDIEKHFIESVSDFLGRNVTVEDIKQATKSGWI